MKNQALFSSKDKSKQLKRLLQFLFGALRVNPLDNAAVCSYMIRNFKKTHCVRRRI